jgi:hypothetical protein
VSYIELTETFEVDGETTTYPECILFERNGDGLVDHVSVFMKYPDAAPPVPGASAT